MKLGSTIVCLAAAAALLSGCDEGQDPDDGSTMDMVSDPDGDRDLEWRNGGDVRLDGMQHQGVAEVVSMTGSRARITSERIVIGQVAARPIDATIEPVGFDPGDRQDIAFAVFTRDSADEPWEIYSLPGTVDGTVIDAYTFRSIHIEPSMNLMEVEVLLPSPDGLWADHFAAKVELGPTTEVALAPYPLAAWSELEGTWEFDLAVRCNGQAC